MFPSSLRALLHVLAIDFFCFSNQMIDPSLKDILSLAHSQPSLQHVMRYIHHLRRHSYLYLAGAIVPIMLRFQH